MTKAEFERQRQLLWVYLRHRGRCAVCGQEMSRDEAAAITPLPVALGIDQLLQIRLAHLRCEEHEARGAERMAA